MAENDKGKMVKVKNLAKHEYHGSDKSSSRPDRMLHIPAGEARETSLENAERMVADQPQRFRILRD